MPTPDRAPSSAASRPRALAGQTAVVTGASSGIGRAVAFGLARAGANVVVNYVGDAGTAAEVAAGIEAEGGAAIPVRADVSREAEAQALFHAAIAAFGTVHILVNNAGLQRDAPIEEMTLADWDRVIGVNLTGQFLCAREAVREFGRRGMQPELSRALGKIICMSSVHEVIPWAGHANYAASKGGVALLMKTLAQELAPRRIRVNSIAPGAIRTPINRPAWETPEALERLLRLIPSKRIGEPEDIAEAAAWLAADASDYVNGATLFVDGGMTLYPGFEDNG
ncbi:MAG: glucose 1-dehydrogenase [Acetobacteraceae bacterium]|nr:glucose 1-dehydrogenase [Acetobacteraceae bacterium]